MHSDSQDHLDSPHEESPHFHAGGWQGLDIVDNGRHRKDDDVTAAEVGTADEPPRTRLPREQESVKRLESSDVFTTADKKLFHGCFSRRLHRLSLRYPRSYHVAMQIFLPLLFLIAVAFLCGHLLASVESSHEKSSNNDALASFTELTGQIDALADLPTDRATSCLDEYLSIYGEDNVNAAELREYFQVCDARIKARVDPVREAFYAYLYDQLLSSLAFEWSVCQEEENPLTKLSFLFQADHVVRAWFASFESLVEEYTSNGVPLDEAQKLARSNADGHAECDVSSAGGALFWFTIMTTIGYGNTAPATDGGRALVYTLGFISILFFTACVGQAGYVCLAILDDALIRARRRFPHAPVDHTRGIKSCLLYFAIFVGWMLVIAGIAKRWTLDRTGEVLPLKDAFWFSYISTTTVGFGDMHIAHEHFFPRDMFYVPLVFLLGFVLLANFLLKLSDVLTGRLVPEEVGPSFEEILKDRRERPQANEESADQEPSPSKLGDSGTKETSWSDEERTEETQKQAQAAA